MLGSWRRRWPRRESWDAPRDACGTRVQGALSWGHQRADEIFLCDLDRSSLNQRFFSLSR
jgi:hypothetical protein